MIRQRSSLARIIGERTMHVLDYKSLVQEVAAFLLSEQQTADLDTLMRDVMQYRQDHGIIEATAVSAHSLDKNVLDDLAQILRDQFPDASHISMQNRIEPHTVGGVRIELAQSQLDMTVLSKLNTFKRLTAPERK